MQYYIMTYYHVVMSLMNPLARTGSGGRAAPRPQKPNLIR